MATFQVDKEKTLNATLFILKSLGECDYHKVFKILYFADQFHLKNYGQPLTGDIPSGNTPVFSKPSRSGLEEMLEHVAISGKSRQSSELDFRIVFFATD